MGRKFRDRRAQRKAKWQEIRDGGKEVQARPVGEVRGRRVVRGSSRDHPAEQGEEDQRPEASEGRPQWRPFGRDREAEALGGAVEGARREGDDEAGAAGG